MSDDPSGGSPSSKPGVGQAGRGKIAPGLYLVGTPIGNLGDITRRAVDTLAGVDAIAAEDTRVTRRLLAALGIAAPRLIRYDDHADAADRERLIELLQHGKSVALVSDAGMPLVADPGLKLVQAAHAAAINVTAIPGPSAVLTALALSGLASDRFLFQGFLPAKQGARRKVLTELAGVAATLVVFESPQRLAATLQAMAEILGERPAAVTRELTKLFEEVRRGSLAELATAYHAGTPPKGEIVIVVGPPGERAEARDRTAEIERELQAALATMTVRDAVVAVAAATGCKRSDVYAMALRLKGP